MARQTFSWKIDWLISILRRLKTDFDALNLTSGTYTPSLTNTANIDSSTAFESQFMRVENVVTVSGQVLIDATTAGVSTRLGISLPVASTPAANQLGGTAVFPDQIGRSASLLGDGTGKAELKYIAAGTNNRTWHYHFTYLIV